LTKLKIRTRIHSSILKEKVMTKTVDFTKEIVCSDENIKVIQVIPVKYMNNLFNHLVIYEDAHGYQNACAVNDSGEPSSNSSAGCEDLTFLNPEPKVVSTLYRNVYPSGAVSVVMAGRKNADDLATSNRVAIIEFLAYDDNSQKVNYIEV